MIPRPLPPSLHSGFPHHHQADKNSLSTKGRSYQDHPTERRNDFDNFPQIIKFLKKGKKFYYFPNDIL